VKREEHVGRGNAGVSFLHDLPASIQKDSAATRKAREEEGAAQVHPDHFEWRRGVSHSHVRDVVICQGRAILCGNLKELGLRTEYVCFVEFAATTRWNCWQHV
jgi:hypothetical protein